MNTENPNNYFITYSNHFVFEGRTLAFRNKLLFDITGTPNLINFNHNCGAWIVNRKKLTLSMAKKLTQNTPIVVDVSALQWYVQERLNGTFHLNL